jgi:hypothetical protein
MAVPVARYLVEFAHGRERDPSEGRSRARPQETLPQASPYVDLDARIAEAEARARSAGEELAQMELDARLAEERLIFEQRIEAARREWMVECGAALSQQMQTALDGLGERVASSAARLLAPFLAEALRHKVIADLAGTIEALIAGEGGAALRIAGPQELLDALAPRLAGAGAAIDFTPSESAEVRVTAGSTVIETELEAWAGRLREAAA